MIDEKQRKTFDKKKIKKKENEQRLVQAKVELVKQEFQDNMKNYMELKLNDLVDKLHKTETGEKLSTIQLKTIMAQRSISGTSPKYSNSELVILFDYYKQFVMEINKYQTYIPSKVDFCNFIGVSTNIFNLWRTSDDAERREIIQKIDDYIADIELSLAQEGNIKEITTIFRAKAEHGYVEAQAPLVVRHEKTANLDEIQKQIEAVNQGKSLIELKQNEDGSFSLE